MKILSLFAAALLFGSQAARAQAPFDSHVHLWDGEKSIAEYEAKLKDAGLAISGFGGMWFGGPNQAREGDPEDIRARNDALVALAKKHPNMMPIATVHPYDGGAALAELRRVAALGVKVLKIHPHTQGFDPADARVLALVRQAGELGVIVVMDNAHIVPGGDSEKLFNLALQAPKTKFVFAHMGGLNFRFWNILKMARTAEGLFGDNIYFDISALVTLAADGPIEDEFIWTMRNVGIDHILIGSDYPQLSLKQTLDAFEKLDLTPEEKSGILHGNARDLFGLTPRLP